MISYCGEDGRMTDPVKVLKIEGKNFLIESKFGRPLKVAQDKCVPQNQAQPKQVETRKPPRRQRLKELIKAMPEEEQEEVTAALEDSIDKGKKDSRAYVFSLLNPKEWNSERLPCEVKKSYKKRKLSGFYDDYMSGVGLDIGYKGGSRNSETVLPTAVGIDNGFPDYDGVNLPFESDSLDYVFTSHCLEHIVDYKAVLQEWYRVIRIGGHVVITVPHIDLYEKKLSLPSVGNFDHKRFYSPSSLLAEIEESLERNSYRVVHLRDNDDGYDYSRGPGIASFGCYEIELVIKKIQKPTWEPQ